MELLEDRPALVSELRRLESVVPEEPSGFLKHEFRTAADSLEHLPATDRLSALYHLRVLAEIALRTRWIAGDGEGAETDGRLVADPAIVRLRLQGVIKRDVIRLAKAYEAVHEVTDESGEMADQLNAQAAAIVVDPAPADQRQMVNSPTGRSVYATFRLCSAIIHPGLGTGRAGLMPQARLEAMANEAAYLVVAWGDALVRAISD